MVEYFVDQEHMEEMDVSYKEVTEYVNLETETSKVLMRQACKHTSI